MTELPQGRTSHSNIGAQGKKQFSKRDAITPDLSWASNPNDQRKRKREDDDKSYANMLRKAAAGGSGQAAPQQTTPSLLETHQDTKRKETGGMQERKPFNREDDLGTRQMDAGAKKKYIEKAIGL